MQREELYRKEAIEKKISPDELDQTLEVTAYRSWLAVLGVTLLFVCLGVWSVLGQIPITLEGYGILMNPKGLKKVIAETPGIIQHLSIKEGALVKKGETLGHIVLKDTVRPIRSLFDGVIIDIRNQEGDWVTQGELVAIVDPRTPGEELEAVFFIPAKEGKNIFPAMSAEVTPLLGVHEINGYMYGEVSYISPLPVSKEDIKKNISYKMLATELSAYESNYEVHISLEDKETKTYKWSRKRTVPPELSSETICKVTIVLKKVRPIELIFPNLYAKTR